MNALRTHASGIPLGQLLQGVSGDVGEVRVPGLSANSRRVREGWAFAACAGERFHGLDFLSQALDAQAALVLWEPSEGVDLAVAEQLCAAHGVPLVAVDDLRVRLGELAARAFGDPSRDSVRVHGVTGTDGKTSVSQFLAQALTAGGSPCGVIGTLGHGRVGALQAGTHTTPDAASLQEWLADFRNQGLQHASIEVSSHGLAQGRANAVCFHTAILTNLSRDHLDYHGTVKAYGDAKRLLFRMPGLRTAVLNLDDAFGRSVRRELSPAVRLLGYSMQGEEGAEVVCTRLATLADGLHMEVITPSGLVVANLALLGRFNAENVLAVIATLVGDGWEPEAISRALCSLVAVPGRMEPFKAPGRPLVVVDYAHTPGALAAALAGLGEHAKGRIWCVFGCGGERDRGKRPLMAAAAEAGAHRVVVTDDNPRGEDPDAIVADIQAGFRKADHPVIRNRPQAIRRALGEAGPEDVVLIAGKGHEDYQIDASGRHDYSDRSTVAALLDEEAT
ncbi:UDP-N-acetylmuramoyl-L-alanyl-D-glutamate--2,6-diaminopimelate ligase [Natronocella acetinitrilica]|uniref:UDP-N-acetylmuramoyl-L-alanyl-D-glutamate--2,6-diaminopimelate ligase n=1 Tax=Natronocella acetinitrilica TaxID=414046 RepID=A0AAE3G1H8_9GAMM|nr:UDP-N-acetylmuramoyl-L-alanyl-D-glutamate--2,6-diaminopimelate ligase [Natronocella acetinitrilica]MCP1673860.1 UDP-N-acetylmuramoyl-L-alanyl-D-glutamate--2,6-diaminopimelate ligase [Natronocella acetinitrilica]